MGCMNQSPSASHGLRGRAKGKLRRSQFFQASVRFTADKLLQDNGRDASLLLSGPHVFRLLLYFHRSCSIIFTVLFLHDHAHRSIRNVHSNLHADATQATGKTFRSIPFSSKFPSFAILSFNFLHSSSLTSLFRSFLSFSCAFQFPRFLSLPLPAPFTSSLHLSSLPLHFPHFPCSLHVAFPIASLFAQFPILQFPFISLHFS